LTDRQGGITPYEEYEVEVAVKSVVPLRFEGHIEEEY
jgi:hypothetical protein